MTPHRWQIEASEAYQRLGGVAVDRLPGAGKTWAAALIAKQCRRPLFVGPASVLAQTRAMFREYGVPEGLVTFASYTWLTRAEQHDFFERLQPSDILMDEFQKARGWANSARKRLERYLIPNPAVRVGIFSASLVTDRLRDFAYAFTLALRGHARRAGIPPTRAGVEALEARFEADPEAWTRFRQGLADIPGVFLDDPADSAGAYQGEVRVSLIEREPALVLPADWSLPDGYLLVSPAQAAEVSRMLAWGYWPRVTPRPSERYLDARRDWSRVVQSVIANGAADTELQVRSLRPEAYAAWAVVEAAEPVGEAEAVWETLDAIRDIDAHIDFRQGNQGLGPTIVWCHHRALQARVAALLACPHHGPGGRDADGVRLDETRAPLVVASIEACHAGLNCQAFSHSLVLEPPSDPEVWRQLIGRTARQGQLSPCVSVEIVVNCSASRRALRTAIERARVSGKPNPIIQLEGKV